MCALTAQVSSPSNGGSRLNILGINAFHWDASACLLVDGSVVAATQEERLGRRVKHQPGFPSNAIGAVLDIGGITAADVDYVAVGYDPMANRKQKAAYALRHPGRTARVAGRSLRRRMSMEGLPELVASASGVDPDECDFEIVNVEHHIAHISSAFYTSPFSSAAGFSFDAAGDFVSTMYAECSDRGIHVVDRVFTPHSLGYFYTALCQFIGFDHVGEEYKVMGLSAYGQPKYLDLMERILRRTSGGQFEASQEYLRLLDQSFEDVAQDAGEFKMPSLYTDRLVEELGPPRLRNDDITQRDIDLAASCQVHFERTTIDLLRWFRTQTNSPNLVMAGGCALNGVTNAKVLRQAGFEDMHIHCAATDDGLAVGAALWAWREMLDQPRTSLNADVYLGRSYAREEMEIALSSEDLEYGFHEDEDLIEEVASRLARGEVVGWFQGRYEWGPRALGNRSLLAHPGWPGMKDLINEKIKRRESFRPFAPSILADRVADFFEWNIHSPFMMHVVPIREERRSELAAVCHEDGTGRLHSVTMEQNPLYYRLIERFGEKTGTPVLLNTSFNENEPIVDSPEQAVATFLRNDVDVLVLGPFIATKRRPSLGR